MQEWKEREEKKNGRDENIGINEAANQKNIYQSVLCKLEVN